MSIARAWVGYDIAFNPTHVITNDVGLWGWGNCYPIFICDPRNPTYNLARYNDRSICWFVGMGKLPSHRHVRFPQPTLSWDIILFMRYQRAFIEGGTYFFTVVTDHRRKVFSDDLTISLLRNAFSMVRKKYPFTIDAIVILPDHIHTIWTMPEGITDYPLRWRLIKSAFTHSLKTKPAVTSASRLLKGEQAVWQRRYWEHLIRDQQDFNHHMDYIHYNPVKHGLVSSPGEWKYSSFHRYVKEGWYPENWGIGQIILPDLVGWE